MQRRNPVRTPSRRRLGAPPSGSAVAADSGSPTGEEQAQVPHQNASATFFDFFDSNVAVQDPHGLQLPRKVTNPFATSPPMPPTAAAAPAESSGTVTTAASGTCSSVEEAATASAFSEVRDEASGVHVSGGAATAAASDSTVRGALLACILATHLFSLLLPALPGPGVSRSQHERSQTAGK